MRYKELKNILSAYDVPNADKEQIEKVKNIAAKIDLPLTEPEFSLGSFLYGQLWNLRPSFWVMTAAYLALFTVLSLTDDFGFGSVILCTLTPFLSVAAVFCVSSVMRPEIIELESACLYKPKTVFAGKTVICGTFDLAAVLAASLMVSGGDFIRNLLFGTLSFTAAAFLTLGMCLFFRVNSALLVCTGLFTAFSAMLFSNERFRVTFLSLKSSTLSLITLTSVILMTAVITLTFKRCDFERMNFKHGN